MAEKRSILRSDIIALTLVLLFLIGLAWMVYAHQSKVSQLAEEKIEIHITAEQWKFTPDNITVIKGKPVTFVIRSPDVTHGFTIEKIGVNEVVYPGKEVKVTVTFDKVGIYTFKCSIYCGEPRPGSGLGHWIMKGTITVVEEA